MDAKEIKSVVEYYGELNDVNRVKLRSYLIKLVFEQAAEERLSKDAQYQSDTCKEERMIKEAAVDSLRKSNEFLKLYNGMAAEEQAVVMILMRKIGLIDSYTDTELKISLEHRELSEEEFLHKYLPDVDVQEVQSLAKEIWLKHPLS